MSWSAVQWIGNVLLGATAVSLTAPLAALSAECLAALLPRRRLGRLPAHTERPAVAVLVPAHNEEFTIPPTLGSIRPQLGPRDRLIVIADNCTDATAAVARSLGAEVLERQDADRRGKGFAMDLGVRHLAHNPPYIVIFIDADCLLAPGAIDELARQATVTGRPAQALYLMEPPPQPILRDRVSAFAFLLKNQVRPSGLQRLGLHSPLFGTGMAFPYPVLERMPLADGNIVEDLQLGLNLVRDGIPPVFCPEARVLGRLPGEGAAAMTQRRRWEHGHVRTILGQAPRLLVAALRRGNGVAAFAAVDLAIPPLSLLGFLATFGLLVLGTAAALGAWKAPFVLLLAAVIVAFGSLVAIYVRFGRETLPARALLGIPGYLLWKAPMYVALLLRPQRQWVQTPRAVPPASDDRGAKAPPAPAKEPLEPAAATAAAIQDE